MLDRSRRVRGLLDHRRAGAAMVDGPAGAGVLDDRARVRRRSGVAAHGAAALDDRRLSTGSDRGMLGRDATGVGRAARAERGAVLAEDLAVRPAAGSPGHSAASSTRRGGTAEGWATSRAGAAEPTCRRATAGDVAVQACPTGDGRRRRLGRRVASAQGGAVAAQDGVAALAADSQSGASCGAGPGLAANTDAAQRAGHMRGSRAVQGRTFTCDQARLTARPDTHSCVAAGAREAPDVAATSEASASGKTGLAG